MTQGDPVLVAVNALELLCQAWWVNEILCHGIMASANLDALRDGRTWAGTTG